MSPLELAMREAEFFKDRAEAQYYHLINTDHPTRCTFNRATRTFEHLSYRHTKALLEWLALVKAARDKRKKRGKR